MSEKDIIEVIVAHQNHKQIQVRRMGRAQGFRDGKWYDVVNPRWNFEDNDYRVAPEPRKAREWDLYVSDNGHVYDPHVAPYRLPIVKVREVIK